MPLFHNDCGGGSCPACLYQERHPEAEDLPLHRDCGSGFCPACNANFEAGEGPENETPEPDDPLDNA